MKMISATLAAIVLSASILTPTASAGEATEWHETVGGNVRVIIESTPADATGLLPTTMRGVIEIALEDGWYTYWREPGASGIPPTFQFVPWSDVKAVDQKYQTPEWVTTDYGDYAGYSGPVLLPFEFDVPRKASARIEGSLLLGVCEDICIPVMIPLEMDLAASDGSALTDQVVRNGFASLPSPAPVGLFEFVRDGDDISVSVNELGEGVTLFAAMEGYQLTRPEMTGSAGSTVSYAARVLSRSAPPAETVLHLLVTQGGKSFWAEKPVGAP